MTYPLIQNTTVSIFFVYGECYELHIKKGIYHCSKVVSLLLLLTVYTLTYLLFKKNGTQVFPDKTQTRRPNFMKTRTRAWALRAPSGASLPRYHYAYQLWKFRQNWLSRSGDMAQTIFRDFKMYDFLTPYAIVYLSVDFPEIFRVPGKYIEPSVSRF